MQKKWKGPPHLKKSTLKHQPWTARRSCQEKTDHRQHSQHRAGYGRRKIDQRSLRFHRVIHTNIIFYQYIERTQSKLSLIIGLSVQRGLRHWLQGITAELHTAQSHLQLRKVNLFLLTRFLLFLFSPKPALLRHFSSQKLRKDPGRSKIIECF